MVLEELLLHNKQVSGSCFEVGFYGRVWLEGTNGWCELFEVQGAYDDRSLGQSTHGGASCEGKLQGSPIDFGVVGF
jgi:hypothetical protein